MSNNVVATAKTTRLPRWVQGAAFPQVLYSLKEGEDPPPDDTPETCYHPFADPRSLALLQETEDFSETLNPKFERFCVCCGLRRRLFAFDSKLKVHKISSSPSELQLLSGPHICPPCLGPVCFIVGKCRSLSELPTLCQIFERRVLKTQDHAPLALLFFASILDRASTKEAVRLDQLPPFLDHVPAEAFKPMRLRASSRTVFRRRQRVRVYAGGCYHRATAFVATGGADKDDDIDVPDVLFYDEKQRDWISSLLVNEYIEPDFEPPLGTKRDGQPSPKRRKVELGSDSSDKTLAISAAGQNRLPPQFSPAPPRRVGDLLEYVRPPETFETAGTMHLVELVAMLKKNSEYRFWLRLDPLSAFRCDKTLPVYVEAGLSQVRVARVFSPANRRWNFLRPNCLISWSAWKAHRQVVRPRDLGGLNYESLFSNIVGSENKKTAPAKSKFALEDGRTEPSSLALRNKEPKASAEIKAAAHVKQERIVFRLQILREHPSKSRANISGPIPRAGAMINRGLNGGSIDSSMQSRKTEVSYLDGRSFSWATCVPTDENCALPPPLERLHRAFTTLYTDFKDRKARGEDSRRCSGPQAPASSGKNLPVYLDFKIDAGREVPAEHREKRFAEAMQRAASFPTYAHVLFLDVDGVLNTYPLPESKQDPRTHLHADKLRLLGENVLRACFIQGLVVEVVLSSAWRLRPSWVAALQGAFEEVNGFPLPWTGSTDFLSTNQERESLNPGSSSEEVSENSDYAGNVVTTRCLEIRDFAESKKVGRWVAVDDLSLNLLQGNGKELQFDAEDDQLSALETEKFVLTEAREGLTEEICREIVEKLVGSS